MGDAQTLERRYRRWLVCYPAAFRREHEAELLTVLLAISRDRQRHPAFAEVVALVGAGLGVRLRPDLPRSARALRAAVGLLCLCAALDIGTWVVMIGTAGGAATRYALSEPGLGEHAARVVFLSYLAPDLVAAPIMALVWLVLAWANGHGRRWGRVGLLVALGATTISVLNGLVSGGADYAVADSAAGAVLWTAVAITTLLTLHPTSAPHYRSTTPVAAEPS